MLMVDEMITSTCVMAKYIYLYNIILCVAIRSLIGSMMMFLCKAENILSLLYFFFKLHKLNFINQLFLLIVFF